MPPRSRTPPNRLSRPHTHKRPAFPSDNIDAKSTIAFLQLESQFFFPVVRASCPACAGSSNQPRGARDRTWIMRQDARSWHRSPAQETTQHHSAQQELQRELRTSMLPEAGRGLLGGRREACLCLLRWGNGGPHLVRDGLCHVTAVHLAHSAGKSGDVGVAGELCRGDAMFAVYDTSRENNPENVSVTVVSALADPAVGQDKALEDVL